MAEICRGCRSTIGPGAGFCPRCGLTAGTANGQGPGHDPVSPTPTVTGTTVTGTSVMDTAVPERSVVARSVGARVVPALAVLACLGGVLGLELPVVEVFGDDISFATADIPYVGDALLLLFVALTLFPVIDTVRGRATFTPWLVVPALIGLVPLALVELGLSYVPALADLVHTVVPDAVVVLGVGPDVLLVVDVGLVVVAVTALFLRLRDRRARRTASQSALGLPTATAVPAWTWSR